MPIKVGMTSKGKGTELQITFDILCTGGHNNYETEISVNNLVGIKFLFKQDDGSGIQTQYLARKLEKAIEYTVKIKVNNFDEKICSDKPNWEVIGDTYANTSIIENCRSRSPKDAFGFHLDVTIKAFKVEATIYKKLCDDTEFTDFQLTTTDGSLAIHKAILAAHSDVFKAMLCREWKETNEGRIQMSGVSLQTLQHLKDYMYMGTLPADELLLPLLSIASCYMITELRNECISKLTQIIKPENLYDFLEYSIENKIPELTFAIMRATSEGVLQNAEKALLEKRSKEEIKGE
ncbi:kelch-like protein 24 [Cydia fagiglandana]|uniref:kelch-like protein 24 n=1 Tax=Cydia fagiglandana TaxID=1458189 RepID=UPI002FEE1747